MSAEKSHGTITLKSGHTLSFEKGCENLMGVGGNNRELDEFKRQIRIWENEDASRFFKSFSKGVKLIDHHQTINQFEREFRAIYNCSVNWTQCPIVINKSVI